MNMNFSFNLTEKCKFVVSMILILIIIQMLWMERKKKSKKIESFKKIGENCNIYGDDYAKCYDSGECTIMLDLEGNAFCTNKNPNA